MVLIAFREGNITVEARQEFLLATKGVEFLFNKKLQEYRDKLASEALNVINGKEKMKSLAYPDDEREAQRGRLKWFNQQVEEIPKLFAPFLKVRG